MVKTFRAGDRVTCRGYEGTVLRQIPKQPRTYEVRFDQAIDRYGGDTHLRSARQLKRG